MRENQRNQNSIGKMPIGMTHDTPQKGSVDSIDVSISNRKLIQRTDS